MKFGLLKERKSPPDKRVVFSPKTLDAFRSRYPDAQFIVESSSERVFSDDEYRKIGFQVADSLEDCDILIGVKEVPADALVPGKSYFFFSHTIKKQPHNQGMLQAILDKDITLYDHETVVDAHGRRLIGFGRYAGIVGAYNAFRALGLKYELFDLPAAETLENKESLIRRLKTKFLPPVKIVLTGKGKVGMGAREILDAVKIKQVSVHDFLTKAYDHPVYVQLDVLDYNRRKDGVAPTGNEDFFENPIDYVSDFGRFAQAADVFIAGHFHGNGAPDILTREMLNARDNKIKIVADVSCDVEGPIACTLRASSIEKPFYGYNPSTGQETDMHHPVAITVMAVDNLPCSLPDDASQGFGQMFLEHVVPAFFNNDKDGILQRSKIAENGRLATRFKYLLGYVQENVPHL